MTRINNFQQIVTRYQNIQSLLPQYAREDQQPKLILVTKNQPVELVMKLANAIENPIFGENRVQEALSKIDKCRDLNATWHYIGFLQRNKVRRVIGNFSLVQSLTDIRLAKEIEKRASNAGRRMDCLLEIDICEDGSKAGFSPDINYLIDSFQEISSMPHINIKGLMTIAPFVPSEETRPYFKRMRAIFDKLKDDCKDFNNVEMEILSMGMSNDYIVALEEGATMIRVGSAIFQGENNI